MHYVICLNNPDFNGSYDTQEDAEIAAIAALGKLGPPMLVSTSEEPMDWIVRFVACPWDMENSPNRFERGENAERDARIAEKIAEFNE